MIEVTPTPYLELVEHSLKPPNEFDTFKGFKAILWIDSIPQTTQRFKVVKT